MTPRRLSDLYVVGTEVVFDDGTDDPVKVWLQKISPLDHETALRRANLVRARILAKQEDNLDADLARSEVADMTRDDQINYLVMDRISKRMSAIEAEAGSEEPWSESGYLQGLRDSWADGLSDRYQENPDDEEALHVFNEMKRFTDIVQEKIDEEREHAQREISLQSDEWIVDQVVERFLQSRSDMAWLSEFRKSEVWLATRESEDHKARYFTERQEVDELSQEVLVRLLTEYRSLSVDPVEGKDLAAPDTSSDSSAPPENQEMEKPSGLSVVSG